MDGRGRWYRWDKKDCVEQYHDIPINFVRKRWGLDTAQWGTMQWSRGGRKTGDILLFILPGTGVRLVYSANGESINHLVKLDTTPQNLGGVRHWWLCPRCGRRCGVLYGGKYFWCRQCHNLTYQTSQSGGDLIDTIDNKLARLKPKLNAYGRNVMDGPPVQKPKHMHDRTFYRLTQEWRNLLKVRSRVLMVEMVEMTDTLNDLYSGESSFSVSIDDLWKDVKQDWEMHKADPARMSRAEQVERYRWLLERFSKPKKKTERLTLGQLASTAGVPYRFAQEAEREGLVSPDRQKGRVKRYRPRLKSWLAKLHTLRAAGMEWAEIRDWTRRRFQSGHEHEQRWPAGYELNKT